MDEATIRRRLEEVQADITRGQQEQEVLRELQASYRTLLQFHTETSPVTQLDLIPATKQRGEQQRPKGRLSFKAGLMQVLLEARGQELEDAVIWERMQAIGVRSNAKRPTGFIGLTVKRVPEIEKVTSRTFRWIGEMGHQANSASVEEGQ